MFIICASVQSCSRFSQALHTDQPTRTAMFLFMPIAELLACRLAAAVAVGVLNVTGVFVDGAPPGAGVR
jgi:hypothetical protein